MGCAHARTSTTGSSLRISRSVSCVNRKLIHDRRSEVSMRETNLEEALIRIPQSKSDAYDRHSRL